MNAPLILANPIEPGSIADGRSFQAMPVGNLVYVFDIDAESILLKMQTVELLQDELDTVVAAKRSDAPCRPFEEVVAELGIE